MREEIHTNTPIVATCTCPGKTISHEISDIEEFGSKGVSTTSSSNNSKEIMDGASFRRRSTNLRAISDNQVSRLRRSGTSLDSINTNIVDTVALCTCQQSQSYPFCDNTHITFNKETNSTLSPIIVAFLEDSNNTNTPTTTTPTSISNTINNTIFNNNAPSDLKKITEPPSTEPSFVDNINGNMYSKSTLQDTQSHPRSYPSVPSPSLLQSPPKYIPSSIKDKANLLNVFTEEEVAEHCTKDSLWMIIKGNVYDITTYVSSHPGGERALLKFAGKDGTENVEYHSPKMLQILNSTYFIGKLYTEKAESSCTIS